MYYFSPLFIKDEDMVEVRNRGTIKALEKKIEIANKKREERKEL